MSPRVKIVNRYGRLTFFCMLSAGLLVLFSFSPSPRTVTAAGRPKQATIVAKALNMRSGPGTHHPHIATLYRGNRVLVFAYEGTWVRILHGEQTGFIINRADYLRIDAPVVEKEAGSASESTLMRTQAERADVLKREIDASQKRVVSLSKEEAAIINTLDDNERALDSARKQVVRVSTELKAIALRIGELEDRYRDLEKRVELNMQYAAMRLAALYKLSWLGKFQVLASTDSVYDFIARKRALESILIQDERVITQLSADKADMQKLMNQLDVQKHDKQAASSDLHHRLEIMHTERKNREALLVKIRSKKALQLASIESLKKSARELDRAMMSFKAEPRVLATPDIAAAEKPFAALKGLLMMPVKGKIVSFFGKNQDPKLKVTHIQSGINIKADRGEPIRAVHRGRALYASWFKGFGNMLIIDHGDHYYTVYAHLEEQFKSKGDPVETGEVVATVGDTGSLTGAGLHFEIRHHGKPMNPMDWIKQG